MYEATKVGLTVWGSNYLYWEMIILAGESLCQRRTLMKNPGLSIVDPSKCS